MSAPEYADPDADRAPLRRVQELPEEERPRERLLRLGHEALRNDELLQILIGSGVQGRDVIELSQSLLARYGLSGLLRAHPEELLDERGLGQATVTRILAAVAIGWRAAREERESAKITQPGDVWELCGPELASLSHEEVRILVLNRQQNLVAPPVTLYRGTAHGANVRVAEILHEVIVRRGIAFLMVHNHPSGDPTPSRADRQTSQALNEAARVMDLEFVDHVIIGGGDRPWLSLRNQGLLDG